MVANASADAGKRTALADDLQRFGEPSLGDERDVRLDVDARRAGRGARGHLHSLNREGVRLQTRNEKTGVLQRYLVF